MHRRECRWESAWPHNCEIIGGQIPQGRGAHVKVSHEIIGHDRGGHPLVKSAEIKRGAQSPYDPGQIGRGISFIGNIQLKFLSTHFTFHPFYVFLYAIPYYDYFNLFGQLSFLKASGGLCLVGCDAIMIKAQDNGGMP